MFEWTVEHRQAWQKAMHSVRNNLKYSYRMKGYQLMSKNTILGLKYNLVVFEIVCVEIVSPQKYYWHSGSENPYWADPS